MSISSNSLFHFTNKFSNLKNILKLSFKVNFCSETIIVKKTLNKFLVPMVSFSDIPLSEIKTHLNSYGKYGIGLSKNWAEKNGLNPVLYIEQNSNLGENFFTHLPKSLKDNLGKEEYKESTRYTSNILRYMKNYEGDLYRNGKLKKANYKFCNEREWRYVPDPLENKGRMAYSFQKETDAYIKAKKTELNNENIFSNLKFELNDVRFIFIKKESERELLITHLELLHTKTRISGDIKLLLSRIISYEQIENDF